MTKKQLQIGINRYVTDMLNMITTVIDQKAVEYQYSRRLLSCNASIKVFNNCDSDTTAIILLRSYNTDVAAVIYFPNGDVLGVDFLRKVYGYTATSAQHIAKFFNHYGRQKAVCRGKEFKQIRYYPI